MAGAAPHFPVESETLLREAAVWFECIHQPDVSVELLIHFARWIDADRRHQDAFKQVETLCLDVGRVGHAHWPTADELRSDTELPSIVVQASAGD